MSGTPNGGPFVEVTNAAAAFGRPSSAIVASIGRLATIEIIDWSENAPFTKALDQTLRAVERFDRVGRFRFAATDMNLAARAADGLMDAIENDGPARIFDRVIETGMIVTYARPFLGGNVAGVGAKWAPKAESDRALHDQVLELRHEYHAHADHTSERQLERADFVSHSDRRPLYLESWTQLPTDTLRQLSALADRQAIRFHKEAERRDLELFGPVDRGI
jgi:hypothetical protein